MELQDQIPHGSVAFGRGVTVQKGTKIRIVLLIAQVHQLFQRLPLQDGLPPFIADGQIRLDADHVIISVHHLQREFMERADVGPSHQIHLRAEAILLVPGKRFLRQRLAERLVDAFLHLGRRRIGKRDDEHVLQAHAFLQDQLPDPFHQYRGLARTCGSRNQQAFAPAFDGLQLSFGPGHKLSSRQ